MSVMRHIVLGASEIYGNEEYCKLEWMSLPLCRTAKLAAMFSEAQAMVESTVYRTVALTLIAAVQLRDVPSYITCPRLVNMVKADSFRHHVTSPIWYSIHHQEV